MKVNQQIKYLVGTKFSISKKPTVFKQSLNWGDNNVTSINSALIWLVNYNNKAYNLLFSIILEESKESFMLMLNNCWC